MPYKNWLKKIRNEKWKEKVPNRKSGLEKPYPYTLIFPFALCKGMSLEGALKKKKKKKKRKKKKRKNTKFNDGRK